MQALIAAGTGDRNATLLDVLGQTGRTAMGTGKDTKVWKLGPWFEAFIDPAQEGDILRVVGTHFPPGFSVSIYTTAPEFGTRVRYFPPNSKIAAEVIKLIAIELECAPCYFEGVYCFEGGRWRKTVDSQASVDLLTVE